MNFGWAERGGEGLLRAGLCPQEGDGEAEVQRGPNPTPKLLWCNLQDPGRNVVLRVTGHQADTRSPFLLPTFRESILLSVSVLIRHSSLILLNNALNHDLGYGIPVL